MTTLTAIGFGDVRLVPKLRLLRSDRHFIDAAVILAVTFPTGLSHYYFGENGFTFGLLHGLETARAERADADYLRRWR